MFIHLITDVLYPHCPEPRPLAACDHDYETLVGMSNLLTLGHTIVIHTYPYTHKSHTKPLIMFRVSLWLFCTTFIAILDCLHIVGCRLETPEAQRGETTVPRLHSKVPGPSVLEMACQFSAPAAPGSRSHPLSVCKDMEQRFY